MPRTEERQHAYFTEGKTRRLWEVGEQNSEDVVYIQIQYLDDEVSRGYENASSASDM